MQPSTFTSSPSRAKDVADLAARVSRDGGVGIVHSGEQCLSIGQHLINELQVQPLAFSLSANDAGGCQSIAQVFVKLGGKQSFSRAWRVVANKHTPSKQGLVHTKGHGVMAFPVPHQWGRWSQQ